MYHVRVGLMFFSHPRIIKYHELGSCIEGYDCDMIASACRDSIRPEAEGSSKAKAIVRARLKIVR
jgi:hypothetical protein